MDKPFPPLDPEDDAEDNIAQQPTRLRDIPFRAIFPNLLTLLAIASGLTSIRFAIEQRLELAIGAIILAAFLDGIDGRVARFLKSTSRFGAQLDSLADFVNFGVAPAMLLYFTQLIETRSFGWIAVLIYAICACLRLARFNVMLEQPGQPEWQKNYFTGVPAPAGAMVVLLPAYAHALGFEPGAVTNILVSIFAITVGLLMVSNLPTFSGKKIGGIRNDWAMPALVLAFVTIALLVTYPWTTLICATLAYLASLPFAFMAWKRNMTKDQIAAAAPSAISPEA